MSFHDLNHIPLSGWTTIYLSIYILKDIMIVSQVLAIVNKVAIHIHVQTLYKYKFSTPLGKCKRAWLVEHMIRVCLVL
jgi:hypothetical protein